jgi:hypothetical protein
MFILHLALGEVDVLGMVSMKSRSVRIQASTIIAAFALLMIPVAASAQAKTNSPIGFEFSPAHDPNPTSQDMVQAALEIAAVSGHGSFMWEWETGDSGYTMMQGVVSLYRRLGLKVFLQLSIAGVGQVAPPDNLPHSFADATVRQRFLFDVAKAASLKPDYLNLGAEANFIYYFNPNEFPLYVSLYQQAYNAVKSISPNTQVGVSYHFDLFFAKSEFNLLTDLGPQDFIAFTTYPAWTVYQGYYPAPDQMAAAYYDRIRLVIPGTTPVIFSEVGWPSAGLGSQSDQDKFVRSLPRYFANAKPVLVTFAMEHDTDHFSVDAFNNLQLLALQQKGVDIVELFLELNTVGLLSTDGPPKQAYISAGSLNFAP